MCVNAIYMTIVHVFLCVFCMLISVFGFSSSFFFILFGRRNVLTQLVVNSVCHFRVCVYPKLIYSVLLLISTFLSISVELPHTQCVARYNNVGTMQN